MSRWLTGLLICILVARTHSAEAAQSLEDLTGTWAETKANCKAYVAGRLDKMTTAEASNHVIVQINAAGLSWQYNSASCRVGDGSKDRSGTIFPASCEFKGTVAKDKLTIKKRGKGTMKLSFAYRFWKFKDKKLHKCAKAPSPTAALRHDEMRNDPPR